MKKSGGGSTRTTDTTSLGGKSAHRSTNSSSSGGGNAGDASASSGGGEDKSQKLKHMRRNSLRNLTMKKEKTDIKIKFTINIKHLISMRLLSTQPTTQHNLRHNTTQHNT